MRMEELSTMLSKNIESGAEKNLETLKQHFDCPVCYNALEKPQETECGHIFCATCLKKICIAPATAKCPLCNRKISRRSLVARDDIDDLREIFQRLSEAFVREMKEFIEVKQKLKTAKSCDVPPTAAPKHNGVNKLPDKLSAEKTSKSNDIPDKIARLKQQEYVIVSASAVPSVVFGKDKELSNSIMDLSMKQKSENTTYVYKSAIKFVKPIDLSKRQSTVKRSLTSETTEDDCIIVADTNENPQSGLSKKRKYNLSIAEVRVSDLCEPTPSKLSRNYAKAKPTIATKKEIIQTFLENTTHSDEILANISESQAVAAKPVTRNDSENNINELENTVGTKANLKSQGSTFKLPSPASSRSRNSRQPLMSKLIKPVEELPDDDFQRPRDSDLLFLSFVEGGNQPKVNEDENPDDYTSDESLLLPSQPDEPVQFINLKKYSDKNNDSKDKTKSEKTNLSKSLPVVSQGKRNHLSTIEEENRVSDTAELFSDTECKKDEESVNLIRNAKVSKTSNTSQELEKSFANQPKKYVFCPTRLNKTQMLKLNELCKMVDGSITREFSREVTHLIINLANGRVPQTLKYLLAIAGRKWVVIYDWVEKCVESGSVVSEDIYETSNFRECDPGVKRSRLAERLLYKDFSFYFATDHFRNMGYSFEDVLMLMSTLGAEVVASPDHVEGDLVIVGDSRSTEYNNWLRTRNWITVTFSWIIECILEYKLVPFSPNHLCVELSESDIKAVKAPKLIRDSLLLYKAQKSLANYPF